MIDPKELRIGNYLKYKNTPFEVEEILINGVNMYQEGYPIHGFEECDPIPLTPEILKSVSFDSGYEGYTDASDGNKSKTGAFYSLQIGNNMFLQLIYMGDVECAINNRPYESGSGYVWSAPKYIHQLQNLYFALTGSELKIEL